MIDAVRLAACLALAATLAACRAHDDGALPAADAAAPAVAPAQAAAVTPSPVLAESSTATPPAATLPGLALDGEGLRLVVPSSGATRLLAFGQPIAPVIDAVQRIRGTEPTRATNGECGAGPLDMATWSDGLTLASQAGTFRGWTLNPRAGAGAGAGAAAATTMSGIGLGSTRAELEAAYDATVTRSSLGTEFAAGGLYGVLESPRADAAITALWAGTSCVFR